MRSSGQRITCDWLIMRAVAGELALEQNELRDIERPRREAAAVFEEIGDLSAAAAFPARKRDVGEKRAPVRLETGLLANAFDLGSKRGERRLRLDSGPQCAAAPLFEAADPSNPNRKRLRVDSAECIGEVVRDRSLDLANETQREVKLLVLLPAEIGAVVHRIDQQIADSLGRSNGDEQAVHGGASLDPVREAVTNAARLTDCHEEVIAFARLVFSE